MPTVFSHPAPVLALAFLREAIPTSMVIGILFILVGSLVSCSAPFFRIWM